MLKINEITQLYLGIQGENRSREIRIDVSDWMVSHPNGSFSVWITRPGETIPQATGATFDADEGVIIWQPTSTDTYVAGEGEAEIRMTEGSVIKKTKRIRIGISGAVTGGGSVLGSDWQSYIDEVDRIKSLAVAASNTSVAASETAVQAKDDALEAQAEAEAARDAAEEARDAAQDAQTAAERSALDAQTAQTAAAGSAQAAQTARAGAETAQNASEAAAGNAAQSATGAAASASNAQESAYKAAQDAERADQAARDARSGRQDIADDLAAARAAIATDKSNAESAIQAKGEQTIESIPEDYTNLSNQVSDLKAAVDDTETAMETGYMTWGKDLWVMGGLKNNGEIDTNNHRRITTSSLQHTDRELAMHVNSGYRFAIAYYTSADVFDSIVWWPDNYTIPRGSYYRITIAKSPDSVVDVTVNELYREVTYKSGLKAEIDDLLSEYAKTENNVFIGINNKKISRIGKINVDGATTVYMCGENFIPMEYSDASVHERNGLTFEVNSDGSVHVSGTATSQTEYLLRAKNTGWKIPAGDYTVAGSINRNIVVALGAFTGSTWVKNLSSTDLYESNAVVDYDGYDNLQISIVIKNAATVDAIVYPQLLYGANIPVSRYIAPQSYKQYTVPGEATIEDAVEYNDGFNVYNFNGVNMSVEYQYLEEPKYNKYLISVISQKNISSHKFAVSNDGIKWSEIGFSIPFDGFQAETQIVHINDTYYFIATANNGQPGDEGDALVAYTQDFINWKMQLVDFDLYDIQIAAGVAPEYCRRWTPSIIDAHGEYYLTVSCATGPDGTYGPSDWSPGETYKTMQPKIIKIKFNSDKSIKKDGEWVDFNLNQNFEAIIDLTVKWAHNLKRYICTFVDNKERVSCVAIARNMGEQFTVQATNIFDMRDVESPTFIETGDEIVYYGSHYSFGETGYTIARTIDNLKFKNEVLDISTTYDQFLLRTLYPFVVDTALMDNFFSQYVLYLGEYFEERINYKKLDVRMTTDRTQSFSSQPGCNYYIQDSGEYDISSFAVKNQYATKQIMIVPKTTCTIVLGDQSKVITENDIGKPVFVYFESQTNAILS